MAKNYEIIYTIKKRIIREAENEFDAMNIAEKLRPAGADKKPEINQIKSRDQYHAIKRDMANQIEFTEIPNLSL